ncbi:MAG: hypothetical protein AB7F89_08010 [Pirellulaceae bacterium]
MATNPILQRIDRMTAAWEEFAAAPAARLACWQLDHDSARMFELFLEMQYDEAGEVPDLFVRFGEPFADGSRYGGTIRESLIAQYEEVREGLEAEGIPARWQPPLPRRGDDGIASLLAAAESLHQVSASLARHVVLVLTPAQIAEAEAWREWLQQLLRRPIPEHVRFLVVDQVGSTACEGLCPGEPERVVVLAPALDMGVAYLELLRQVPGAGPGAVFRRFYVALGNAVTAGDLELARRLATHAGKIAQQQQWPQLQAAVALLLGGGWMARQDYTAALDCYRQGRQVLGAATDPVGQRVALQASFAEGSALLAAGQTAEAAKVYEQIHTSSMPLGDSFARLEGARMAAYCHELAGNRAAAWTRHLDALTAGETMGESARQSTLPYAGQAMLRLGRDREPAELAQVRQRLDQLLGQDWERSLPQGSVS